MKDLKVNVEKLEKLTIPCGWCFAAGVVVGSAIVLT